MNTCININADSRRQELKRPGEPEDVRETRHIKMAKKLTIVGQMA